MAKKGELHHKADLTDAEVVLMRGLYDDGKSTWSIQALADKFEVPKSTAQSILTYRTRVSAKRFFEDW